MCSPIKRYTSEAGSVECEPKYSYKMKGDAIAQLSDQIKALTSRMQEIERKQSV